MGNVRIAISKNHFYTKETGNIITTMFDVLDLGYQQIADFITKGHAITNIFDDNGQFHRAKKYFTSADFFALDFDNKKERINNGIHTYFSLDELLESRSERANFIMNNAFLIYTTQTHTEKQNKFRAMFHLPSRVDSVYEYEKITTAFHIKFPEADKSCKEAARYYYGTSKSGLVKVLSNRLMQTSIDLITQQSIIKRSNLDEIIISEGQTDQCFESYANNIIENEKLKLVSVSKGDRNNILNSVCFVISMTISEMRKQGLTPQVVELENFIKTTALRLGLEPDEIRKTYDSGWNTGKVAKFNTHRPNIKKLKRTHANKSIECYLQINKRVIDHLPEPNRVEYELKQNAIKTQIGFFNTFQIDFQETITEQLIDKFLQVIGSMKFLLCYFSLWKYAHKIGKTSFTDVNLNNIISYSSKKKLNSKNLYKERESYVEIIKILGLISILREHKSKDENIASDYNIVHLINDLSITSNKGKTYISCALPKKQGDIGAYIPDKIFEISRKDEGSFFLVVAFMKEINRTCKSKKEKNGKFLNPKFENKPITWTRRRLIHISRLGNTDRVNKTEANQSIEKKLQKLDDLNIIQSFSKIPLDDDEKVTIVLSNPEKSPYELEEVPY